MVVHQVIVFFVQFVDDALVSHAEDHRLHLPQLHPHVLRGGVVLCGVVVW